MIIHGDRIQDPRRYNAPTASEVAAIMVGDGHELHTANRDILLRMHDEVYREFRKFTHHTILFIIYCYFQKVMVVGMWMYLL